MHSIAQQPRATTAPPTVQDQRDRTALDSSPLADLIRAALAEAEHTGTPLATEHAARDICLTTARLYAQTHLTDNGWSPDLAEAEAIFTAATYFIEAAAERYDRLGLGETGRNALQAALNFTRPEVAL